MLKILKDFVTELQQLEELGKKKWLVILTAVSVFVVIFLWVLYLNATVISVNSPNFRSQFSNWDIFKTGLSVIGKKTEYGLANSYVFFHEKFSQGNTFTIQK